jgi:hypothetical protein
VPEPQPEAEPAAPEADTAPPVPEDPGAVLAPEPGDTPTPAPRVAPRPADRPERDVAVAPELQEAAEPVPADETPPEPAETQEAEAPEAATPRIVTEATEEGGAQQIARAPTATPRPRTRPDRPAPAPDPEPEPVARREPEPEPDPAPQADPQADAIADAVAEAVAGGGAATGDPGPPMTAGERDALRLAVQECWVVDVGSEAANVTVTVGMRMSPDGTVVDGTLRMLEASGGSDAAIQSAFQSARRAILRCQRDGYDLPAGKYAQWEEIEMVFNPEEMRLR